MIIRRLAPVALLFLFALAGSPARGADAIHAHADRVSGQVKEKNAETVVMEGNVIVNHGKTSIVADHAVYDKKAGIITFTGNVGLTDEEIFVRADELVYLRKTKEGTFRGSVRLARSEEKDASGKVVKEAIALDCDTLVFDTEKKSFTAQGRVNLAHKDFSATAGEMVYDDGRQELRLTGSPVLIHKDETIQAEEIVIAIAADTFKIIKAAITFSVADEETAAADAIDGGNTPPRP